MPVTKSNSPAIFLIVIHRPIKHFFPVPWSILCFRVSIFFFTCKNCFPIKRKHGDKRRMRNWKPKIVSIISAFRRFYFYWYLQITSFFLDLCFNLMFNEKPFSMKRVTMVRTLNFLIVKYERWHVGKIIALGFVV